MEGELRTVRYVGAPKKGAPPGARPSADSTRNISPAPSQSDEVITGVCTCVNPAAAKWSLRAHSDIRKSNRAPHSIHTSPTGHSGAPHMGVHTTTRTPDAAREAVAHAQHRAGRRSARAQVQHVVAKELHRVLLRPPMRPRA